MAPSAANAIPPGTKSSALGVVTAVAGARLLVVSS